MTAPAAFPPRQREFTPQIPADRFQRELTLLFERATLPAGVENSLLAVAWFLEVESFREQEDQFLLSGQYEQALDSHRLVLSQLIATGEKLMFSIRKHGLSNANFKAEDVAAALQGLHSAFRCEHGEKNSPEINAAVAKLLGA